MLALEISKRKLGKPRGGDNLGELVIKTRMKGKALTFASLDSFHKNTVL